MLLHELCHIVAGHPSTEGKARWDLQVEALTFVLCQMVGGAHPRSANYLLHYQVEPGQMSEHLEMIGRIVRDVRHMLNFRELAKEVEAVADQAPQPLPLSGCRRGLVMQIDKRIMTS